MRGCSLHKECRSAAAMLLLLAALAATTRVGLAADVPSGGAEQRPSDNSIAHATDPERVRPLSVRVSPMEAAESAAPNGVVECATRELLAKKLGKTAAQQLASQVDFQKEKVVRVTWQSAGPPFDSLRQSAASKSGRTIVTFAVVEPRYPPGAPHVRGMMARIGSDFFAVPAAAEVRFKEPSPSK